MTIAETYACTKLQCGRADLCMLEQVYSPLAESAFEAQGLTLDDVLEEYTTLEDLLYVTYKAVAGRVNKVLKEKVESVEDQEAVGSYVREQQENFTVRPFINYLCSRFNNDLDDVVDWDEDVEYNADLVFDKWVEA